MDMSWIESSLTRLERQLSDLIEGDPAEDGIPRKLHRQLGKELVSAMRSGIRRNPGKTGAGSQPAAPDEYTLLLPTLLAELLLGHPRELDRLGKHLEAAAGRAGAHFSNAPILRVVADPSAVRIKITADFNPTDPGNSRTASLDGKSEPAGQVSIDGRSQAFIIINGLSTYLLTRSVINVGRDPSNDIQVDDLRVSRMHAQIRYIQGRFVIFDLDSTGGTTVNNIAVSSHILSPGDVILLAGVPLVFGQEQMLQDGYTQEVLSSPLPPEAL